MRLQLTLLTLTFTAGVASATTFDLNTATGLFTPSFRGDANTTWVGWDTFGAPGTLVINDTTPDIGTDGGSFVTTNGEDHQSGSLNYYSSAGSVAEDITFDTDGTAGSGFTTIIIQANTLFGTFGPPIFFSPIGGVSPTVVNTATEPFTDTNALGEGQLFVKYEVPGLDGPQTISIAGGGFTSFDQFVVDTLWSPTGFAADTAIATPEPSAALIALLAVSGVVAGRRV